MDTTSGPLTRVVRSAWTAALLFLILAIAATWPLAAGLGRDVPSDYGDPLYAAWAMAWVSRQIGRALTGHADAITGFWDANQLYPEPATLALSDHFVAQALPFAPIYWLTGNALLTLGLAYLLAFTLLGFCTWLLVREMTGSSVAGVLAGAIFAVNELFVVFELAHLQMLSAHWMPLALYGLRRYFEHGSRRALALAVASIVMLNLSAGYYLLMFPPFVALYVAWEVTVRGRWRHAATWRDLMVAGLVVVVATAPFLWPYLEARQRFALARTTAETTTMAATVDGYVASGSRLFVGYLLALLAVVAAAVLRAGRPVRSTGLLAFALTGLGLAFWLSLGPAPAWGGQHYPALGLYGWLQEYVPGMDALRVSSRYAVIVLVFLSLLAGMGAALVARIPRFGVPIVLVLAAVSVIVNVRRPFPVNGVLTSGDVHRPAAYLTPGPSPPAVYRYLAALPPGTVVAELPFVDLWYNTRYLYFSTFHWKFLNNGFTSFFPPAHIERVRWLVNPVRTPDEAWGALESGKTTHVVVHTGAWDENYVKRLEDWLEARGARRHGRFDGAEVFELPPW